ncbi:MAG: hypothetical protein ACI9U2_004290 [Bradymonadia bacterium]|jgi:hypothetical protein
MQDANSPVAEQAKAPAPAPVQQTRGAEAAPATGAARSQSAELVQFALTDVLQKQAATGMASGAPGVHDVAAQGMGGAASTLPHLDTIQASFGQHDVSSVQAHSDSAAVQASAELGAHGYASGDQVAFGSPSPSLHLAAHEAAHVVQQRGGVQLKASVGAVGDVYERHADAVADQVVQGKSAEPLLDQMASAGGSPGVQAKAIQFEIKADLRTAIDGLGTDEAAVFNRLKDATPEELLGVMNDPVLMAALRDDFSYDDMIKILSLLKAPLATKIKLAIRWLSTDEAYIQKSFKVATAEEQLTAWSSTDAVDGLRGGMSTGAIHTLLTQISAPLTHKLRYAITGTEPDLEYIATAIAAASVVHIKGVLADAALMTAVEGALPEVTALRGMLASRCWALADGLTAFTCIDDATAATRTARLLKMGPTAIQQAMLDAVIGVETDPARFGRAFQSYWAVEIGAIQGATMAQWPLAVLRRMHAQLKVLPDKDTRSGFWKRLTLSDQSIIDPTSGAEVGLRARAAWGAGNFIVGTQANTTGETQYGYGTKLTAAAAIDAQKITVEEGDRLQLNDVIKIGSGAAAEGGLKITAIADAEWTLDKKLTKAQAVSAAVEPDDGSATRNVNWLDATVRHEIAHGVDENLGATVKGFTETIGGWWSGDFDGWIAKMSAPWTAAPALTAVEKAEIKAAIVDATTNQKGSLYGAGMSLAATHPVVKYQAKNIPVIVAAEACLSRGDAFFNSPAAIFRDAGKGFTVSFWYKKFMYFNESIIAQRVKNYGLYAPTEFFAEAYTVFYEEAGKAGVTDADHGRLLRNATWRNWMRTNIHDRSMAPAGTGASGASPGASPGGSRKGRQGGDPGP